MFAFKENASHQLNTVSFLCRLNKDPTLPLTTTLSDFHIISTLAVGEFGHIDLVRVDLIAAQTQ